MVTKVGSTVHSISNGGISEEFPRRLRNVNITSHYTYKSSMNFYISPYHACCLIIDIILCRDQRENINS